MSPTRRHPGSARLRRLSGMTAVFPSQNVELWKNTP
jgi:hypothetical protein